MADICIRRWCGNLLGLWTKKRTSLPVSSSCVSLKYSEGVNESTLPREIDRVDYLMWGQYILVVNELYSGYI